MKKVFVLLFVLVCISKAHCGVALPINWKRLTCKVTTIDSIGTAFVLRYKDDVFIVSNRHVVTPGVSVFHLNSHNVDSSGNHIPINFIPDSAACFFDGKYDLAFVHISKIPFLPSLFDLVVVPESLIGDDSMIVAGRDIFFLGYPNGKAGQTPSMPLVRSGIIAGDFEERIILDGNIFGGSSGSPLFLDYNQKFPQGADRLIGIISGYYTMPIKNKPSIMENMGIGVAIKISYIINTIETWRKAHPKRHVTDK